MVLLGLALLHTHVCSLFRDSLIAQQNCDIKPGDGGEGRCVTSAAAVSATRAGESAATANDLRAHKYLLGEVCRLSWSQPKLTGGSVLV